MTDFFSELGGQLDRSARRRVRVNRARPVVLAMAAVTAVAVTVVSATSLDLAGDQELAAPAPAPAATACSADRPPAEITERFGVLDGDPSSVHALPAHIAARITGDLPGGRLAKVWVDQGRLAREGIGRRYWIAPALAGTCESPEPTVCVVYEKGELTLPACVEVADVGRGTQVVSSGLPEGRFVVAALVPDTTEIAFLKGVDEYFPSIEGNIFEARYEATDEQNEKVRITFTSPNAGQAAEGVEHPGCKSHSVAVTHEPPSEAVLELLPMFKQPNTKWSPDRASELLDTPKGPYKSGVHIDHVQDLGSHGGWQFQAAVIGDVNLTQPVDCAPKYDPAQEDSTVCVVYWKAGGDPRHDCSYLDSVVSLEHFGVSTSSRCIGPEAYGRASSECRLIWWLLPDGAQDVEVVPTNAKSDPTGSPIPMLSVGQMHFADVNGLKHYELRYVDAQGKQRSSNDDQALGRG